MSGSQTISISRIQPELLVSWLDANDDDRRTLLLVVDCRDEDRFNHGFISTSVHYPSRLADASSMSTLVDRHVTRSIGGAAAISPKKKITVVFYCGSSNGRAPRYADDCAVEVASRGPAVDENVSVVILDGGFKRFKLWAMTHGRQDLISYEQPTAKL